MSPGQRLVVLNTRPLAQAVELTRLLENAGFAALEIPAIEVVPAWRPAELEAVGRDLVGGRFDWVVLPSQNAGQLLTQELGVTRVVCGIETARALGLVPELALDRFSAGATIEALRTLVEAGQHILVPHAEDASDELIAGLESLGAIVHAPIAYRTAAVAPATLHGLAVRLRNRQIDAVTVCSPSAMYSVLAAVGRQLLAMSLLICLGETTASAARQAGVNVDGIAEKTTMASLVAAVRVALTPTAVLS